MSLDPALVHPKALAKIADLSRPLAADLSPWERISIDTLVALDRSLRSPAEMSEAAGALNPMLDLRTQRMAAGDEEGVARLDALAARALEAAIGARDARSGMAVENWLDALRMALDDARDEMA